MPAILPNYEYDIFISYRQNDNKRDGWVSNFVQALRDELEATLKNPVSIYFDENPHDGLLESHQVGASLEKKLRCLVFIPIISQTYCDTTCFAWEHEFLPFNRMAHDDELGMNITLANGNVASRVLPIKIHELDTIDEQTFENELGGKMRSIDFIYKEAGVNRPLKPTDNRNLNQEKLEYNNQINKVANALKELGTSLVKNSSEKNTETSKGSISTSFKKQTKGEKRPISLKLILGLLFLPVVITAAFFLYTNYYENKVTTGKPDKSIAVLPFRNDSNDPANIYFCNGLMEDIINQLSQIPEVRVPSATSMLYYRDNPKPYEEIIDELRVSYLLEASVRKTADKALMNITLIDAEQNKQLWSERIEIDLSVKDLFDVQFEVANAVANKMRIAMDNSKIKIPTTSYEAYDKYIRARDLMKIWDLDKNRTAINLLQETIKLDDKFQAAIVFLGQAYGQRAELSDGGQWLDSARHYSTIAYDNDNQDAGAINALGYSYVLAGRPREGLELYKAAYEINSNITYNYAGWCYFQLGEFEQAIRWANQNIVDDPKNSIYYVDMANATNALGLFDNTIYYSKKALEINADHTFVYDNLKEMEYYKGNYHKAIEHLQRVIDVSKSPKDEALMGIIYYKMGNLEKAKHYFNIDFRAVVNEDSGDENSKLELYSLLQNRALVTIKLGEEELGKSELQNLLITINENLAADRPEKYLLMAGGYATLGNTTKSIENLNKVLEMGFNDYYAIINNALLDPLHDNVDYKSIVTSVKERNDKMRENILQEEFLSK